MNLSHAILAMLAAPAALCVAAHAESAPEAIAGYLPCNGSTIQGSVVRPVRDNSFVELHRAAIQRFMQLPKEKQEAINAKGAPDRLMEYDADLWPDKAEYEKYTEAWKKTRLALMADVRVGLKSDGNNMYSVLSATRVANGGSLPLTIGSLRYNAAKNVWVSNNGELTGSEFSAGENFDYGAQTGNEWKMEKKDSLSSLSEMIRLTKATDGKAVFLYYSLQERSVISGTIIAITIIRRFISAPPLEFLCRAYLNDQPTSGVTKLLW